MFGFGRGRTTWAAPLLLFLAVLLVAGLAFNVANLDTGGEAIPTVSRPAYSSPSPPGSLSVDTIFRALFSLLSAAFLVTMVYVLLKPHERVVRVRRKSSRWDLLRALITLILFLAVILLVRRVPGTSGDNGTQAGSGTSTGVSVDWPTAAGLPAELFLIGGLFAGLMVLFFFMHRPLLRGPTGLGDAVRLDRRTAVDAVREAIERLELGGDVRSAILACYQRFCLLLGERGVDEQTPMTARELEAAAVHGLDISAEDASQLTSLFEEARYSEHPLGEGHRDRAVRSFEAIRAALEA